MAGYFTADELKARVGGAAKYVMLTDDTEPPDGITDPAVETMLIDGTAVLVDSYIGAGGYDTPLPSPAQDAAIATLKPRALDIANYRAKSRGEREPTEADTKLYEDAIRWLEAVAKGTVILEGYAELEVDVDYSAEGRETMFDRDRMAWQ